MSTRLAIGTMTGTSMDGIDVALLETDGLSQVRSLGHVHWPMPTELQVQLRDCCVAMRAHHGKAAVDAALERELTQGHVEAINQLLKDCQVDANAIDVIGFHGQTVFHDAAQQRSVQLGDATWLQQQTGITVVHQLRQNDLLHGGQGAPLAPAYHRALVLQQQCQPCVVINCGGITNATFILAEQDEALLASDLGPGMCLLDRFIQSKTENAMPYDHEGTLAHTGHVNQRLYEVLMQDNDYTPVWPQSFDAQQFILPEVFLTEQVSLSEGAATLVYHAAIVSGIALLRQCRDLSVNLQQAVLVGGGWRNRGFRDAMQAMLPDVDLVDAAALGWRSQAVEAECFAYLAVRAMAGLPLSWPGTTGVRRPVSGGLIQS